MMYLGTKNWRICYEFAPHEMALCRDLADQLNASKAASRNATPLSGRTLESLNYDGMLGEYLAHHHYGEPFSMQFDDHIGDAGYDMIHRGARFQIKTTPYRHNPLLLVKKRDPQIAHIYLLVRASGTDRFGALLGYATRSMIFKEENLGRLREDLPINYMLREHELKRCQPPSSVL